MSKVVFKRMTAVPARSKAVDTKRVRGTDGTLTTVYTLNADIASFGDDLGYVFRKNVEKARRRHKSSGGTALRGSSKG